MQSLDVWFSKKTGKKSSRLFESDFMDRMTRIAPITPFLVWPPVMGYFFWKSFDQGLTVGRFFGVALSALLFWTFTEYWLHRIVFHLKPIGEKTRRIQFLIHGIHHDEPNDSSRLVMPILPAFLLAVFFYSLFSLFLHGAWLSAFFGWFIFGYMGYDLSHFLIHHFRPKTSYGKFMKKHHMDHHFYHDKETRFGVSVPLWDYIFRTHR